jgi:citrate synthase
LTNQLKTRPSWISAQAAADLLGVKVQTLYAYVSRGLIAPRRVPGQRASQFAHSDIAAMAQQRRARRPQTFDAAIGPDLETALTAIRDGALYYRGRDATELAQQYSFERVGEWLWSGEGHALDVASPVRWLPTGPGMAVCHDLHAHLPTEVPLPDRIRQSLALLGPFDAFRFDLSPDMVRATARALVATLVETLPLSGPPVAPCHLGTEPLTLAGTLWSRLGVGGAPSAGMIETLNAALVLLIDHELATSTFAARVAASARADPYSVILAGLGAVAGRLHGGVGPLVVQLLLRIGRPAEVVPVIAEHLKHESQFPGFGHPMYPRGDPRARVILAMLHDAQQNRAAQLRLDIVDRLLDVARGRNPLEPNVDFAVAALCYVGRMPPGAAEAIFSLARCVGWVAHAIEEYASPPLRFRIRADYVGPPIDTNASP